MCKLYFFTFKLLFITYRLVFIVQLLYFFFFFNLRYFGQFGIFIWDGIHGIFFSIHMDRKTFFSFSGFSLGIQFFRNELKSLIGISGLFCGPTQSISVVHIWLARCLFVTFNEEWLQKYSKNVKCWASMRVIILFGHRVWGSAYLPLGQSFLSFVTFPVGFPSPPSMFHSVLNQIWTFCPFPSETNQLHEPSGQACNLDMDLDDSKLG